ncbi:MAG: hypothetical protein AAFQ64_17080 [Pseudomonadota bacterium]
MESPSTITLTEEMDVFAIKVPPPGDARFDRNVRLSEVNTPAELKLLTDSLKISGLDGQGLDIVFDLDTQGRIIGVEVI